MRVITFSTKFPSFHPRAGQPTQFVEKIILSLIGIGHISIGRAAEIGKEFGMDSINSIYELRKNRLPEKHHTIRAGNRWKVGDKFSPRIWTGLPYRSKQKEFVHPIEIVKTWKFEVDENGVPSLDNFYISNDGTEEEIATNDGLSMEDFSEWIIMPCFRKGKQFTGQIICWNEEITY